LDDVECGLTIGVRVGGAGAATRCSGVGRPGRFREKSGMFGLPFFFIVASASTVDGESEI